MNLKSETSVSDNCVWCGYHYKNGHADNCTALTHKLMPAKYYYNGSLYTTDPGYDGTKVFSEEN